MNAIKKGTTKIKRWSGRKYLEHVIAAPPHCSVCTRLELTCQAKECFQMFDNIGDLKDHLRVHNMPYEEGHYHCKYCMQPFWCTRALKWHEGRKQCKQRKRLKLPRNN